MRKLLIMGLPGAGKTTLATAIAPRLNAVDFNADEVRANINKNLGFSERDRIEQARRMDWLCDQVVKTGGFAIADFICPTEATRAAFLQGGAAFVVWVNRIDHGRYEDTNQLFRPPENPDIEVSFDGTPEFWAEQIVQKVRPIFNSQKPTALLIGRYQPFHAGHKAFIVEALKRVGQVCIGVRDTSGTDGKNPFSCEYVRAQIEHGLGSTRDAFWLFRYQILRTSSMAGMWATGWSGSNSILPSRRFQRRQFVRRSALEAANVLPARSCQHSNYLISKKPKVYPANN